MNTLPKASGIPSKTRLGWAHCEQLHRSPDTAKSPTADVKCKDGQRRDERLGQCM